MTDFVDRGSIVRRIWGNADIVLLIFAGCAAEFPLNRAVDWLFFTGKLPGDPIGRLFSTASYAQQIVFADSHTAARTLERIRNVHQTIERERGQRIPNWAYRDVLYMLIGYSEAAYRLVTRALTPAEQNELYHVFYRVGIGLGIPDLPPSYTEWRVDRERHLRRDLVCGDATKALYAQYRNHLGRWRYRLLLGLQMIVAPAHVRDLLKLKSGAWLRPAVRIYSIVGRAGFRSMMQRLVTPPGYLAAVRGLDHPAQPRRNSRSVLLQRTIGPPVQPGTQTL